MGKNCVSFFSTHCWGFKHVRIFLLTLPGSSHWPLCFFSDLFRDEVCDHRLCDQFKSRLEEAEHLGKCKEATKTVGSVGSNDLQQFLFSPQDLDSKTNPFWLKWSSLDSFLHIAWVVRIWADSSAGCAGGLQRSRRIFVMQLQSKYCQSPPDQKVKLMEMNDWNGYERRLWLIAACSCNI